MSISTKPVLALTASLLAMAATTQAETPLRDYFGFSGLEIIAIGDKPGPMKVADLNNDGLPDIIVVNNRDSRIDLLYQKPDAKRDAPVKATDRVNELPDHWMFSREYVGVAHEISAIEPFDFDGDGDLDLVYAASKNDKVVFLEQKESDSFKVAARRTVPKLEAGPGGFRIIDVMGDDKPELAAITEGKITIWPLDGTSLGSPEKLSAGTRMQAFIPADYNGDGLKDIAGIIPDDMAPVRIWFGQNHRNERLLGAQTIFEMPPINEFEAVGLPGKPNDRIAVIERSSHRVVVYDLGTEPAEGSGDREASFVVYSYTDPGNRNRDEVILDIDGDGLEDLITTDTRANAVVIHRQVADRGMLPGETFSSLSDIGYLAASNRTDDDNAELYVLSEKEGVIGRSELSTEDVPFPRPLGISDGYTPVAMNLVELENGPHVAVVASKKRDYVIDLISGDNTRETIELGQISKAPETVVALDADQDGMTDLLLFTQERPMIMLHAIEPSEDGARFEKLEKDEMGQFGLVSSASADNTVPFDIEGDGTPELLIADKNFVRAVRYDMTPKDGASPGWQVVEQFNTDDPTTELVAVAAEGRRIVAADKPGNRLVIFEAGDDSKWSQTETLRLQGFPIGAIHTGSFTGDGEPSVLVMGRDGYAVVRLGGERRALEEVASWRSDDDRSVPHELAVGDINSDGYGDMVSLDAGNQNFDIFTYNKSGDMLHARGFKIFESKMFSGGDGRETQPREIIITDLTGDGKHDVVMLCHDRVLIYPQ
ncbi:MAG: VCBS repeat-containing protein [Phycisphaerales bacterium]|nr:VCBS repeat-containing protein [Phycisphaerales bacterium]